MNYQKGVYLQVESVIKSKEWKHNATKWQKFGALA